MHTDIWLTSEPDVAISVDRVNHAPTDVITVQLGSYTGGVKFYMAPEAALTLANRLLDTLRVDEEQPKCVTYANGDKAWYLNGKLHRTDGPAIEGADGYKAWWLNGKLHRTDGPAIEYANGDKAWYLNGESMTEEAHADKVAAMTVDEVIG